MQIGTIQHLSTHSTVLTNSTKLVSSVVNGEWRWQPQHYLLNSVYITFMSVCVIERRGIGSCNSRGWCARLLITGICFHCYSPPPADTDCQWRGIKTRTCTIIQIIYLLPKLCHLPQYWYGLRDPTIRVLGFASYPGLRTRDPYSYWGRWHSMATHT